MLLTDQDFWSVNTLESLNRWPRFMLNFMAVYMLDSAAYGLVDAL